MAQRRIDHDTLFAYAVGELSDDDAGRVEAHVASSRDAAEELARIRRIVATMRVDDSVEPPAETLAAACGIFGPATRSTWTEWLERLDEIVARLTYDSRLQPALSGYRGAGDGFQLTFESQGAEIDLEVQPNEDATSTPWVILGNVAPSDEPGETNVALLRRSDRALLEETIADGHGDFRLHADHGSYALAIRVADRLITLPEIRME